MVDPDNFDVEDADVVFRRVPHQKNKQFVRFDQGDGTPAYTSALFKPKEGEDGTSVYVKRILESRRLDASSLLKQPVQSVVRIDVADIRVIRSDCRFPGIPADCSLDVVADAWPDDVLDDEDRVHSRQAAHALIVGMANMSKAEKSAVAGYLASHVEVEVEPRESG